MRDNQKSRSSKISEKCMSLCIYKLGEKKKPVKFDMPFLEGKRYKPPMCLSDISIVRILHFSLHILHRYVNLQYQPIEISI